MLKKTFSILAITLFALLPFHAFLVTFWRFGLDLPLPVNAWKEGVIILLFFLTVADVLRRGMKKPRTWSLKPEAIDLLDLIALLFLLLGLASSVMQFLKLGNDSFVRIFYGFKYDFLPIVVFLLFRHSPLATPSFDGKKDDSTHPHSSSLTLQSSILKVLMVSGTVVLTFAFLQLTVLPNDFLSHFGYSRIVSSWDPSGAPAMYHSLDKGSTVMRLASTFAGPNQFGMYCLILVGLWGAKLRASWQRRAAQEEEKMKNEAWRMENQKLLSSFFFLLSSVAILGVFFSYSRSALLGLIIASAAIITLWWQQRRKAAREISPAKKDFPHAIPQNSGKIITPKRLAIGATVTVVVAFSSFFILNSSFAHSFLVRASSSQGHWERSIDGLVYTFDKPFLGHGIGDAGPASAHFDSKGIGWIPESWYLQISLEYGLIGLAIYVALLACMTWKLHGHWQKTKDPTAIALLFSFIAINVACLTLHAWEDSAVALTWWGLAGVALHVKKSE